MTNWYDKIIETQNFIQTADPLLKGYDEYVDRIAKVFLEQSINDKYHYSRILIINILNKFNQEGKLPFESFNMCFKNDEQIIPNTFNYENLASTINIIKKEKEYFTNLIDVITFNLIPSLFLMFLEENSFDVFIEFIMNLSSNENDFDLPILLSRSIFVSPFFLQFTNQIFYPIFKPPYHDIISLDNVFLSDENLQKFQKRILNSIRKNIQSCPSSIIKFLKAFKAKSQLTAVQILKKCIFDPIISNPSLYLTNDICLSEYQDENEKISSILKLSLTDDIINQIYEIMESNNSYLDPFLNKKDFNVGNRLNIYHKIVDMIDILAINQIQSILEGNEPSIDIIDLIYNNNYKEYSLFAAHFDGEIDPWICIKHIFKKSRPFKKISNNDEENDQIKLDYFLEILKNNLRENDPKLQTSQSQILFNQIQSIFLKNPELFSQEDLEKQLDLMKAKEDVKEEITNEINEKLTIVPYMKKFSLDSIQELFYTLITTKIKPEEIEFPLKTHIMIQDISNLANQFEKYLRYCNEKAQTIDSNFDFKTIFYHRYWHKLQFYNFLSNRKELKKYDSIMSDFLGKNYSILFENYLHPKTKTNTILKTVEFVLKNIFIFESEMKQICEIFENNDDPLSKFVKIEKIFGSYLYQIKKYTNEKSLLPDDIFGLKEIFLGFANPPYFISNIVYMNEFLNYINYPNSFLNFRAKINFYLNFVNFRINELIKDFNFPIFYLSRNHIRKITFYITGDDVSLMASVYKSIVGLALPDKASMTKEELNELAIGIDKDKIPEKFVFENELEVIHMGVVIKISLKVSKQLKDKEILDISDENKKLCANFGVFASSCSEHSFESPEQKFINLLKLDAKFIVFNIGANINLLKQLKIRGKLRFAQVNTFFNELCNFIDNYQ